MASATKQRIAGEWLTFVLFTVIGVVATYFAFYFHKPLYWDWDGRFLRDKNLSDMWADMTSGLSIWLYILIPYLGFWFVRSIIWSVNALRRH